VVTRKRLAPFALCVTVSLLFAALYRQDPQALRLLELRALDARQQIRGPLPVGPEVAIVAIDERSLTELGRWPWPRSRTAELIREISRRGAAAIALDIVFAEPQPQEDAKLAEAIQQSGRVVLGYFIDFSGTGDSEPTTGVSTYNLIRPGLGKSPGEYWLESAPRVVGNVPEIAMAARRAGYFNMLPDEDGIFRRVPVAVRYAPRETMAQILTPLSMEALRRAERGALLGITLGDLGVENVTLGKDAIPVDERGHLWVNYAGPARTFPHFSAVDVLSGKIDYTAIQGRIILVGTTATGAYDIRSTPFDPVSPGVEIHANVIEDVLRGRFVIKPPWLHRLDLWLILLFGLLFGAVLAFLKGIGGVAFTVAALGSYLGASQLLFVRHGIPLGVVYQTLSMLASFTAVGLFHYMTEAREKRRIRSAFELYLEPTVARLVSEDPSRLRLHGEKTELTVLFADLRDFTSRSESVEPEQLVEFMNEYFGVMTEEIFRHGGLVDKYIGDAIMALWGAPVSTANHALKACEAALDMAGRLDSLQSTWQRIVSSDGATDALPRLGMGVGINTGLMIVGNIGSRRRFNYTVLGDAVNFASRLEACNKLYGTRVLIGENTRAAVGNAFVMREIDSIRVKGKRLPVRISEVLARRSDGHALVTFAQRFEEGLRAYQNREWTRALELFDRFAVEYPTDTTARIYLERCQSLLEHPPDEGWDGVYTFTSKYGDVEP
jgi:adenylate cyclase